MLIEIQSLDKDKITGKITLVAAIRYPESVHGNHIRTDTDKEKVEKKVLYDKLMAIHNDEHNKIRKLHLGTATLTQDNSK